MRDVTRNEEPIRKYSPSDEELEFFHGFEDEFDESPDNTETGHRYGCRCSICREADDQVFEFEDQLYSDFDQEAAIEHAAPPTAPKIKSCNASQHKHGIMHVVRWKNRYRPCDRRLPLELKLAILSRARTRVPLRVVDWLIQRTKRKSKDPASWVFRIPKKFTHSHVDLTIELFYQSDLLSNFEISEMFGQYLTLRHHKEKGPHCDRGFFLYQTAEANVKGKVWVEKHFGLRMRGLNLDKLYQRGGVSPHGRSCKGGRSDETPDHFVLLCYITLPNAFEHELKPVLPPPPPPLTPREKRMQLGKAILEVSKTHVSKDKDTVRRERMKCLLRLVTGHLVDDDKIQDLYTIETSWPPSRRNFIKEVEKAWRASGGNHEKFWKKLNTLHAKMYYYMESLRKKKARETAQQPPSWWHNSESFMALCDLRKRSRGSNDIMRCFRFWLDAVVKDKKGRNRCEG